MSQDIKSSTKQAHLHAVSKPARTSTIKMSDPNAKSRVLDPGTSPETAPTEPAPPAEGVVVPVALMLPGPLYEVLATWAREQHTTVEELIVSSLEGWRLGRLHRDSSEPPPEAGE